MSKSMSWSRCGCVSFRLLLCVTYYCVSLCIICSYNSHIGGESIDSTDLLYETKNFTDGLGQMDKSNWIFAGLCVYIILVIVLVVSM